MKNKIIIKYLYFNNKQGDLRLNGFMQTNEASSLPDINITLAANTAGARSHILGQKKGV